MSTPTCSPGPGTSFLRFLKVLKILIFLNRKFHRRFFQNMPTFQLKPRDVVIIGNPIEIDSNLEITSTESEFQIGKKSTVEF